MKVVVQRVKTASVEVNNEIVSKINQGYLLLVGLKRTDTINEIEYIARKVSNLRIFNDSEDKLNLSIKDVSGEILSISQFTIYGDANKSNRPSFIEAMEYQKANDMYLAFNQILRDKYGLNVLPGVFGEHMNVSLINDGPVTIILEKEAN
jgi:D-tyrosyl-tRNA(Tyr) deacylase